MLRLKEILKCIDKCKVLADIGTDHAYLPIEAVRGGVCEKAIACDIFPKPLQVAEKNIKAAGLADKIETRLGDGLSPLNANEADCIVISGMGGVNIIEILSAAPEKITNAQLVLSPQQSLEKVRRFLLENSYSIEEKLIRENSRFYIILKAQSANEISPYTDAECFTGRINSPYFPEYLNQIKMKILRYINSITDEKSRETAKKQLKWLEEANAGKMDN